MKDLYLKTEGGVIQIEPSQAEKYNLETGDVSPYNRYIIVDKYGNYTKPKPKNKESSKYSTEDLTADGMLFKTSEVLDLAQGVDSDDESDLKPE